MTDGAVQTGTARLNHALRERSRRVTEPLDGLMPLVVNNKEHGLVHKLSEHSRRAARDKRRTFCGWKAGGASSNVRFCSTSIWPPLGVSVKRLCSKCFPRADSYERMTALSDDPIVKTD